MLRLPASSNEKILSVDFVLPTGGTEFFVTRGRGTLRGKNNTCGPCPSELHEDGSRLADSEKGVYRVIDSLLMHTGQHYDENMSGSFSCGKMPQPF